jgi:hypothetical protein
MKLALAGVPLTGGASASAEIMDWRWHESALRFGLARDHQPPSEQKALSAIVFGPRLRPAELNIA